MRKTIGAAALALAGTVLAGAGARAQDEPAFGANHQVVVTAERLFGFVHTSQTTTVDGADTTMTGTEFSLFSNPLAAIAVYSTPRLALDVFAVEHLSLGGSVGFFTFSQSGVGSNGVTGFLVAPRVGYAIPLSRVVSFWPRVGLTYITLSGNGSGSGSSSLTAVTVEAPFVFAARHVYVSVAPTLDLGVGGSSSANDGLGGTASVSQKETDYGVQCALGGYF
jgi:hypothetical protein